MNMEETIAKHLLSIGAVELKPNDPFTWASGIKSPIYCDNRLTLSYPLIRKDIAKGFVQLIRTHYPDVQMIAGTATAGIPHAAWVADLMDLPMCYVRSSTKGHGKQNMIEGKLHKGQRVVIIEDLISTGGSSLAAAKALQEEQAHVLGVAAIFSYGFAKASTAFAKQNIPCHTLSQFSTLLQIAENDKQLTEDDINKLIEWQQKHASSI